MVRLKTRYILFEILYPPTSVDDNTAKYLTSLHQASPQAINTKVLLKLIRSSIEEHFGSYGTGTTGSNLVLKYFSNETSTGIIRCSREYYRLVSAAITLINKIDNKSIVIRVVKVSGTIKKCETFAMKRNQDLILRINKGDIGSQFEEILDITDDDNEVNI